MKAATFFKKSSRLLQERKKGGHLAMAALFVRGKI
jgi:hypothetical protein